MIDIKVNNEIRFILDLLDEFYPKRNIQNVAIKDVDLEQLLLMAEKNNLLYYVSAKLLEKYKDTLPSYFLTKIEDINSKGDLTLEKIRKTIKYVDSNLKDIIYLKTYRAYQRIPSDLDVYTTEFDASRTTLEELGLVPTDLDRNTKECAYFKEDIKIHLHGRVAWLNRNYFDDSLITSQLRQVDFAGTKINISNATVDFLIHLAHINFEPLHFTLSDMFYIYYLSHDVNWSLVEEQSKRYHWYKSLLATLRILDDFHYYYYGEKTNFPKLYQNKTYVNKNSNEFYNLPKSLPRMHVISAFISKGVLLEPLLKINKVIKVLVSNNSYDGYYEPAEKVLKIKY